MDAGLIVLLIVIAFFAGIGIAAIGPGGIFVTIALFLLTAETPGTVAGTAHTTFIATGIVGTLAYYRSGELATRSSMRMAAVLSVVGLAGALLGVVLNGYVSEAVFGLLLGGFVSLTGGLIIVRKRQVGAVAEAAKVEAAGVPLVTVAFVGLLVGVASGLLGVGGPVIAVPLLVLLGVPFLLSVGVAQVQSIFIALFAAAGYAVQGEVSVLLAVLVGIPQLVGVYLGWRVAHHVDEERLKWWLAVVLLVTGPYIALF